MKAIISKTLVIFLLLTLNTAELLAGPGGKIAKAVFTSTWGKIGLLLLVIIFLPFIVYTQTKQYFGVRKTKKDLRTLSRSNPNYFDEISLKNRMTDIFTRVHQAWSNEDLAESHTFMSNWYWQNQQTVFLDKWKNSNLQNICNVKEIHSIKPLHLRISGAENYEGSRIMMKIEANMEDYLIDRTTKRLKEGKIGFEDVTTVWTIILDEGTWKVDNIEQSEMISEYAKMENILPVLTKNTQVA